MQCNGSSHMSEVWALIIGGCLLLILYGVVSANRSAKRQREAREKVLPYLDADTPSPMPEFRLSRRVAQKMTRYIPHSMSGV